MSVLAYMMLKVRNDRNKEILEEIKKLDETLEAYIIFGAYDLIIKGEFKSNEDMGNFVVDKLKSIEGVLETQTNVCADC
ncbi:Lrp/AsnC family transcriptional regulator [Candidatus Thorarchaeota archaeon]|nr:MAG: Lrp/AsnC family transcriptional regulator [Candidatus Thorarchaeota archaeon]